MKNILTIFTCCLGLVTIAQSPLPVLKSNRGNLTIREGKEYKSSTWRIAPELNPDVYEANVIGKNHTVTFISDIDSVTFNVKMGQRIQFFVLLNGKDSAFTEIVGVKRTPKVTFTKKYMRENDGKTLVETPPMYELVNIIIALTKTARADKWMVDKETAYYNEVLKWFDPYATEPFILKFDSILQLGGYSRLKMAGYFYRLTKAEKIKKDPIFHLTWDDRTNPLKPYIDLVESFAKKSNFMKFYNTHLDLYAHQRKFFSDSANAGNMIQWLRKNFSSSGYNVYKIIFSPLVYANQSADWFITEHFTEAQAHINFPYFYVPRKRKYTPEGIVFNRGTLLFTEFNHSFINPVADKPIYLERINKVMKDRTPWQDSIMQKSYSNAYLCFNEYMNWALISLYALDQAPAEDITNIIESTEITMVGRGFLKFKEFNQMLLNLYKNRQPGQTVADLYPAILDWCEKQ